MALDCDVLIAGGGPTGAMLGLLLARAGVSTIVVEKEPDIYPLPRAAHVDHEIVRIFQEVGVAASVMATSRTARRYDFLTADRQILLRFEGSDRIGPGGWPAANMIHQPSVEAALRRAVAAQHDVELRSGWTFTSFQASSEGVVVAVDTPDGPREISAAYLIGADGARSPVRAAAGIGIDDLQFDEPWLVIDAIVHDPTRLPDANLQICDPARPTTCVLMGNGRHRWEFMIRPGEDHDAVLADDFIDALLRPWDVEGAITLERKAVYRFNARIARHWRKGRVFLAGDAAHQMPPFAGQGLCSGQRDAANLAWKLAAVQRGAPDALLDTYQTEREPNVRGIIDMAIMMGRTVCITDPATAAARDAQMLAARAQGSAPAGAISYPAIDAGCILPGSAGAGAYFPQPCVDGARLDDVLGPGAWLISQEKVVIEHQSALRTFAIADDALAPFCADLALWLREREVESVLVRPDRHVFGTGPARVLLDAWRMSQGATLGSPATTP